MKKYFILICLLTFLAVFVKAQSSNEIAWRKVDSVKRILSTQKGKDKVNCLNLLAESYMWIWDDNDKHLDTACMYANKAFEEAKKINYKTGIGYAKAGIVHCALAKVDENSNNNDQEPAYIQAYKLAQDALNLADQLKDDYLSGLIYYHFAWKEKWSGTQNKFKENTQKAIQYFEKIKGDEFKDSYKPLMLVNCAGCKGTEALLAHLHQDLATIYFQKNIVIANNEMDLAIQYYKAIGNKMGLGRAYLQLAELITRTSDLEAGIIPLKKAIIQFHESGDAKGEFDAHMRICRNYWNLGDFENGFSYCKKGIALAKELSNNKTEKENDYRLGEAYYWMSRYYLIAGDFESALYFIKKTEPFYQTGFRKDVWATAIGGVYRSMGNVDSAKYYLLPLAKKSPLSLGMQIANVEPSRLYISLKEYDKAVLALNHLIKKDRETNNYIGLGNELTVLSKAYLGKNDYNSALSNAREALAASKRSKHNVVLIENYETLAEIFNKIGKNDSAYFYLKQYTTLKDSLLNRQFYFRLNNYKKEAEEIKRTSQIKLLQKDNLIKQQQLQQQILMQQKNVTQLALLNKNGELKDKQLLIKDQEILLKDQHLKEQAFLRQQKESQLALLNNQNKLKDQQLKQQSLIRKALLAGLLLLLLLAVLIYRGLTLKRKNEKLLSEKKQAELQKQSSELEMQALRAQMNPHFIFNCLSSINKFILKNESRAASDYLTRFSRLIRMVLTNSQLSMIPLSDEIEMLRLYLDMERLRFSNSFNYNIIYANTIEPETIYLPPMLLQPFCENAIWHGLMHKKGQGNLNVVMSIHDEQLQCVITDNGVGRAKAAELKSKSGEKQKSFGLKITTERLALFNNEKTVRTFYNTEDVTDAEGNIAGTEVTLHIKYKNDIHELTS